MKKLLLLFGFLTLLFIGSASALAAEKSYTIEFTGIGGSSEMNADKIMGAITTGKEYVTSISATKIFGANASDGLRIGSSGSRGSLTINLSDAGKVKAKKIVVTAKKYGSDTNCKVAGPFSATHKDALTAEFADYDFNNANYQINPAIESIDLKVTTKRGYIKSVTVYYEDENAEPTAPAKPIVSVNGAAIEGATYKYEIGKTVSVAVTSSGASSLTWTSNGVSETVDGNTYSFEVSSDCTYSFYGTNDLGNSEVTEISFVGITPPATFIHSTLKNVEGAIFTNNDGSTSTSTNTDNSENLTLVNAPQYSLDKNVRLDFLKGNATTWHFAAKADVRWYLGGQLKISTAPGKVISKIEFTKSEGSFSANEGNVNNNIWTAAEGTEVSTLLLTCTKKLFLTRLDIYIEDINVKECNAIEEASHGDVVKISDAYIAEENGKHYVVTYDMSNGNVTSKYAINYFAEPTEDEYVNTSLHHISGTINKSNEEASIDNAKIEVSATPIPDEMTVAQPEISFVEDGELGGNDLKFIHKPLALSHPFICDEYANATIYYTRDGSTPDITTAREENASAASRARAEGETETENVYDTALDAGTFVYSGPFYAVHPTNWAAITPGNEIKIKAIAVPSMPGAHLWTASAVAESLPIRVTTGILDITAPDADAIYYTIQGIRVANPTAGNLYIRVAGGTATKVRY